MINVMRISSRMGSNSNNATDDKGRAHYDSTVKCIYHIDRTTSNMHNNGKNSNHNSNASPERSSTRGTSNVMRDKKWQA